MAWRVLIDTDKCTGDGECADICPMEVYEIRGGKAVAVNQSDCIGCGNCVDVCEACALTVEEK